MVLPNQYRYIFTCQSACILLSACLVGIAVPLPTSVPLLLLLLPVRPPAALSRSVYRPEHVSMGGDYTTMVQLLNKQVGR